MELPHWTADYAATVQAIAALFQTVAAILALGIAIGVPWWQRQREQRQRKDDRRAKAIALICIITPGLIALGERIDELERSLPDSKGFQYFADGSRIIDKTPSIAMPEALVTHLDHLHVLGGMAAICVMRLFRAIHQFNSAEHKPQARLAELPELQARLNRLNEALSHIWPGDMEVPAAKADERIDA